MDLDGKRVMGVWPKDFTYYRDMYKDVYSVICKKTHDKIIAPELKRVES